MRGRVNEETEAVNDISSPTKSGRGYCGYLRDPGHCDNDDNDHSLKPAPLLSIGSVLLLGFFAILLIALSIKHS